MARRKRRRVGFDGASDTTDSVRSARRAFAHGIDRASSGVADAGERDGVQPRRHRARGNAGDAVGRTRSAGSVCALCGAATRRWWPPCVCAFTECIGGDVVARQREIL